MFSHYKERPIGKCLVSITPTGGICYVSELYGGSTSDPDMVIRCGLLELLRDKAYTNGSSSLMADRGFNSIGVQLLKMGIMLIAPPTSRVGEGEAQFSEEDSILTRRVASLRIHVERAIAAIKQWRYLQGRVYNKHMDLLPKAVRVAAAMVNLTHPPFAKPQDSDSHD